MNRHCAFSIFPKAVFVGIVLLGSFAFAMEWKPAPEKITLLAVNAHPDDEGIFFGGALPYYAGVLQVPTMVLSMTSGDWNTNNLTIREEELRRAAWTYGLRYEPIFLRFRDVPSHNMSGNPYATKINATWDYWADGILQGDGSDVAAGKAKAVNRVAEIIRRYRPEVIITHDFNGEYGHDNHKATAIAVSEAYYVAADPNASATNLVGMDPWRARKLYIHLYPTNALFHDEWEHSREEFAGKTARQVANDGLDAHVSQRSPDVSTYYLTGENFDGYDSERWGLFASTVGLDTPATNGTAVGTFLQNLDLTNDVNRAPEFFPNVLTLAAAAENESYTGQTIARFATDLDKVAEDILTFEKTAGPSWLTVAANGFLSGTPNSTDGGLNLFTVRVTDSQGEYDEALLKISVLGELVAAWNFNEGTGDVAYDTSGMEHHAELVGVSWIEGRDRGALSFTGTNYAESANVHVGNELTLAAWIRSDNLSGEHAILGELGGYTFKTSGSSLRFTTPGIRDHTFAAGLTTGQWLHVAVTYQAGVSNGCRFYLNGQPIGSLHASAKNASSNPTWIGKNQFGQHFAGQLDDVRIYRVALNAAGIQALHSNSAPAFLQEPILVSGAIENESFQGETLSGRASDAQSSDVLSYRKISGPGWLDVSTDGTLTGIPATSDIGTNTFYVEVADQYRATGHAHLQVVVAYQPTYLVSLNNVGGALQLTFVGDASQSYTVWGSSNLFTWTPLYPLSTDSLGRAFWNLSINPEQSFYYRIAP